MDRRIGFAIADALSAWGEHPSLLTLYGRRYPEWGMLRPRNMRATVRRPLTGIPDWPAITST
jgi:hypothetical protein